MCIGELGELCTWWCFVILVHLMILNDVYFGENNEMWIICMWLGDPFHDDNFFVCNFEMLNCIYWVD